MRTYFIAVALSALSFVTADMKNFTIDPNEVPASTRCKQPWELSPSLNRASLTRIL